MNHSSRTLQNGLTELKELSIEWMKAADYETDCETDYDDEKSQIARIFERVNEAKVQFEVPTFFFSLSLLSHSHLLLAGDWRKGFRERIYNRGRSQGS